MPTWVDVLEPLESRILLALAITLDNGMLLIQGTEATDVISLDVLNGQVTASVNSSGFTSAMADVKQVTVKAGGGDDRVSIGPALLVGCTLYGGKGNDWLHGGVRGCKLYGEDGNDTLIGGAGQDTFSGAKGIDTISYSDRTENLVITLDGKANDGLPGIGKAKGERDNIMGDIENVIGGLGDDMIVGNALRNTLQGGAGNDTLLGGAGDDLLVGGLGDDSLQGDLGDDIFLAIDSDSGDTLNGGDGFDTAAYDSILGVKDTLLGIDSEVSVLES